MTSLGDQTDLELMLLVRDGDENAFETLMLRHEDRAFSLAMRVLNRRDEAKDVVQDVFIKIWERPEAWKPEALFTTWLYRVVTNHALNARRKLKLKSFLSLSDPESTYDPPADSNELPDSIALKKEKLRNIEKELMKLPTKQRIALHLRYQEELSVAEIAEVLGASTRSAESHIYRGKVALREKLTNEQS